MNTRSFGVDFNGKTNRQKYYKRRRRKLFGNTKKTGARFKLNKKGGLTAKAPRSEKYRTTIIPLRKEKKRQRQEELETLGQGFLPSDPNALCERLELLMATKQAGNTGFRNEIVRICDELLRHKIISHDAYKNLMPTLNKDVNH